MSTAKPNLASWERRLLAAALDAALLFVTLALLVAIGEAMHMSSMFAAATIPVAYIAYHSSSLLQPRVGFGRIVAGITVISIRGSGEVTRVAAIVRPIVRLAVLGLALLVGSNTEQHWLVAVPFVAELALIAHTPWRQSLADLIAGTLVINSPPPQPHRAPAVPMYSTTDAEFGPPPRRKEPNHSIERTATSQLRRLAAAAHVKR